MNIEDALKFAKVLKRVKFPDEINFGKFILKGTKGVDARIQYNQTDIDEPGGDLLQNKHEYTFPIADGELMVSLQLYLNSANCYRLFCYTRIGSVQGMTFSVNLTTEKEDDNVINLVQKIKFIEQYKGDEKLAKAHRQRKQIILCNLLNKLGYFVSENNELVLGSFNPIKGKFLDTTPEKFLNDFLVVSLLKGHFQGNKGYQLEILPDFNNLNEVIVDDQELPKGVPTKIVENKSKRAIPLGMRYKILRNDGFKCVKCGNGPNEGVKLHIDHITPFSHGGLTEINNLQTLCEACNLGKSNRYVD